MDISQRDYQTLDDPPTDGTDEPEAEKVPEPPNIVYDEIEVASEEELQRIIEQEGKVLEPEIAAFELEDLTPSPGEERALSRASYLEMHPTHFNFRADVGRLVNRIQKKFPWQTFANTYYQHPPVFGRKYERVSVDFWGGGRSNGKYVGYRGKPIGSSLGQRVFNAIFHDKYEPNIFWIIWHGRMWMRGTGWGPSPWGPPDSDAGHYKHIHVTYVLPAQFAGYTVVDQSGEKIGKVDDLFLDENDQPEYFGVKMGFLGTSSTLIPADITTINHEQGFIEVCHTKDTVKDGPTFNDDRKITPEFENEVRSYYGLSPTTGAEDRGTYADYRSSGTTSAGYPRPRLPLLSGGKDPTLAEHFEEKLYGPPSR